MFDRRKFLYTGHSLFSSFIKKQQQKKLWKNDGFTPGETHEERIGAVLILFVNIHTHQRRLSTIRTEGANLGIAIVKLSVYLEITSLLKVICPRKHNYHA